MINLKQIFSKYFVDEKPRSNGFHLVHKEACPFLPQKENRLYLGIFNSGDEALNSGKSFYKKSEACRFCTKEHSVDKKAMDFAEIQFSVNYPVTSMIKPLYEDSMHSYAN